jgi:4-hydroxythreonine-4-phosphate dehydrogenase
VPILADGERVAGVALDPLRCASLDALRFEPGRVSLAGAPTAWAGRSCAGRHRGAGRAAMRCAGPGRRCGAQGLVGAIVFAPLNKHALRLGGLQQEDELRHLQQRFGVDGFVCEFNITGSLWTSRVTSHVPLRDVAALITPRRGRCGAHHRPRAAPGGCGAAAHRGVGAEPACRRRRLDRARGDRGHRAGRAARCRLTGLDARGPYSPDTVFIAARRGDFDAVVSMYHDQGQIAMKLMGFERGVTLHGGLPVPVATSASGSAYDIAGRGIAGVEGLQAAFDLCVAMASHRR